MCSSVVYNDGSIANPEPVNFSFTRSNNLDTSVDATPAITGINIGARPPFCFFLSFLGATIPASFFNRSVGSVFSY